MQRGTGIMLVAIAAAMLLSSCALRATRDDYMYSRSSNGLWDADYGLIDWNFPTSQNQPPAEAPQRFRPERTAIGVVWATTDAWPYDRSARATAAGTDAAKSGAAKSGAAKADERGPQSAADAAPAAAVAAAAAPTPAAAPVAAATGGGSH